MLINSYRFGYTAIDSDAATYITAVETADGQTLESATKQAIDAYVQALKADTIWTSAAQLLLPCGPRTLAGALVPLKGTAPTNGSGSAGATQFTSGNYSRKSGLGDAANTAKYLNSNVVGNTLGATSHALSAYGSIVGLSGDIILIGAYGPNTTNSFLILDELQPLSPVVRAFRSGSVASGTYPTLAATVNTTCLIGSRTSTTSSSLYADGTSATNATNFTPVLTSFSLYIYSLNAIGAAVTFSKSILQATGIFSTGLNATQAAALRSATATYVAAINAAF